MSDSDPYDLRRDPISVTTEQSQAKVNVPHLRDTAVNLGKDSSFLLPPKQQQQQQQQQQQLSFLLS
jgi:hypothetical protein